MLQEKGFEPTANMEIDYCDDRALLLIKQLPETYRRIIRMRYVQDLSFKEMSFTTKQSPATMAVQSCRGLKKLRLLYHG